MNQIKPFKKNIFGSDNISNQRQSCEYDPLDIFKSNRIISPKTNEKAESLSLES